ncbi:mechanosensitive ion channel family protein [Flammeovirga agarivorans]|uniref:Mechanosensitive ion channel family protein n=1 Tax=Flammeovirga agarivorans TaxID=2726742 RepID=A0A7X8SQK0_9BACT|nr:mechanosensitive ion channel family protein [Flammeovirga agarivorans]NLR94402.1 mechanosensitive ion channel family protein [Flammeovirga agarivorans]
MLNKIHLFILLLFWGIISVMADNVVTTVQELSSYPTDHDFYNFAKVDSIEYSLSTPYHTLHTHIDNLDEDNYHPGVAAMAFPKYNLTFKQRKQLAIELKLIFFQKGIFIDNEDIPLTKNYIDKKSNTNRYFVSKNLPNIYLEKQENGEWMYSIYSTQRIHTLFRELYPSLTSNLVLFASKPKQSSSKFLGVKLWQWASLAVLIISSYLFYYFGVWLTNKFLKDFLAKINQENLGKLIVLKLRNPIAMIMIMVIWYYMVPFILLSEQVTYVAMNIIKLISSFYVIILLFYIADIFVVRIQYFSHKSSKVDKNLIPVIRVCFRITFIVIGILFGLSVFGIDVSRLITGISFGGVALAFAAQDTVKNFFGSLMIFADKPFVVGDWVNIKGQEGIVEEIGFRTTRIRTFQDSLLNIPNGTVVNTDVDNFGKREYRRYKTYLSLPYNTTPDKIEEFIKVVKDIIKQHPRTRKDFYEVHMNEFSASSLDVLLYVFFSVKDWSEELNAREELILSILRKAKEIGVDFAFPTQTLYMKRDD